VPNASPEDAAKVVIVIAQSTLEEFMKRVRRDPESGRKLNEEDLQEVFRSVRTFYSTSFATKSFCSCTTKPSRSNKTKNAVLNAGKDISKMIYDTHSRNSLIPSISTCHTMLYVKLLMYTRPLLTHITNVSRSYLSLSIWQSTRLLTTKKAVVLPFRSL